MTTLQMQTRSQVEAAILEYLQQHGEIISLRRLAGIEICTSYSWAWHMIRRLQARGLVKIERYGGHGRPLRITLVNHER